MLALDSLRRLLKHPLVLPLYLPSIFFAISMGMLTPILPLYAADFDIPYGLIGLVLSGPAIGALVGDIPAGMLLRRLGIKWVMLLGIGGVVLTTTALYWAGSIPVVIGLRLASGFCQALYGVARHAFMVEEVSANTRGRALAGIGGIFRLGRFIGPVISGWVAFTYGLRAPFPLYGLFGLVIVVIIVRWLPDHPLTGASTAPDSLGGHVRSTIRTHRRILATAGAGQVFAQMIRTGWSTLIPLYGTDVLGLDVGQISAVISLLSVADASLSVPAGVIMDRLGRKFALVPSFGIQALGMILLPLTVNFAGLALAALVIGFGNGLGAGTMMTLGADLAPEQSRGEFLGVWRLIGDTGGMAGPLVVGGVADLLALPAASLVVAGCGLMAAAVFGRLMPETRPRRTAESS